MSLRIRTDGRVMCAALNEANDGDIYINDDLHYHLSVIEKVLVTTECDYHMKNGGEWWWKGKEPKDLTMDKFYYTT
jgi:hypothetical protein